MHLGTSINRLTNLLLTSTLTSWNSPFFWLDEWYRVSPSTSNRWSEGLYATFRRQSHSTSGWCLYSIVTMDKGIDCCWRERHEKVEDVVFFFCHVLASSNKLIHVVWVSILVFSLPTTHPFMDHMLVSTQPSHPTQLNITQIQAMTILSVLWMHNRPLQLCAESFWTRDVGGLMLLD